MMSSRRTMNKGMEQRKVLLQHSSSSSDSMPPPLSSSESETEDEEVMKNLPPPTTWARRVKKKVLSKQLSMREMMREEKWEKRKRQMYLRSLSDGLVEKISERDENGKEVIVKERRARVRSLTDEDLDELRGSIDLGFGFNEENGGQDLCRTLPALNLYFAINRQLSDPKLRQTPSPATTPTTTTATSSSATLYGTPSPRSPNQQPQLDQQGRPINSDDDTWRIFKPGDSPQRVKARLRHWAQIVACSVRNIC